MKRAMLLAALGVTTLAAALLLWEVRQVVLLFALALAIAAAVRPLVDALVARGLSRVVALLAIYLVTVGVASVSAWYLGVELAGELQKAGDQLLAGYERLRGDWIGAGGLRGRLGTLLPAIDALRLGRAGLSSVAGNAVDVTIGFLEMLAQIVLVLVLALYWDAYRQDSLRFWLGLLRPARRRRVRELWTTTLETIGEQVRNEIGQSLVSLGVCALVFRGLGMSYWLLPSLAVAVARLFPFVGGVFGTGAAALAGWVDGPAWAVLAGLVALTVHIGLEQLVSRRLLQQRPGNPVILIFAAMVLVDAYGLVGLVLAPLAAAAIQPTLESAMAMRASVHPTPARDLPELRARLDALKAKTEAAPPEVQSLVARLDGLVGAAADAQAP